MHTMKPIARRIRRHFGATAQHVAIRSQRPWYWRLLVIVLLILLGYGLAYWQFVGGGFNADSIKNLRQQNQLLHANVVQVERQLQVERSAQTSLAKEMSTVQDESMRLKEDVAFYKNILNDNDGAGELKFYSFRLNKGAQPGRYDYHILLSQSGRHNNAVQGQLRFTLSSAQGEKTVLQPLTMNGDEAAMVKINFKYYQRLEGSLVVPYAAAGATVEASFTESGASQPRISQKADLPV